MPRGLGLRPGVGRRLGRYRGLPRPASGLSDLQWSTVVGVVEDGQFVSFREDAIPVVFQSLEDVYSPRFTFHMRGVSAEAARRAIERIDPGVPVVRVATMSETADAALLPARIAAFVSGFVGAVGLALACIGLFGSLSYVVAQRAREIGLCIPLGARALQIIRLVGGGDEREAGGGRRRPRSRSGVVLRRCSRRSSPAPEAWTSSRLRGRRRASRW